MGKEGQTDWEAVATKYAGLSDDVRKVFLHPVLEEMALTCMPNAAALLDYGCGTGALAARMANRFQRFGLVDISPSMLECARRRMGAACVETFLPDAFRESESRYDLALNSLVLTTLPDDSQTLRMLGDIRDHLIEGGQLLFASTHPCFTFSALNAAPYRESGAPYRVTLCPDFEITEYHRPLAQVMNLICRAGFVIRECREAYDDIAFYQERGLECSRYAGRLPVFLVARASKPCGASSRPETAWEKG